jgi:starvation-inducible outer membrane lipoprotein
MKLKHKLILLLLTIMYCLTGCATQPPKPIGARACPKLPIMPKVNTSLSPTQSLMTAQQNILKWQQQLAASKLMSTN